MESVIERYRRLHSERKQAIIDHFKAAKNLSPLNYHRIDKDGGNKMDYFFYAVMAIKDYIDKSYGDQKVFGDMFPDYKNLGLKQDQLYTPSEIVMQRLAKNVSYVAFKNIERTSTKVVGLSTNLGVYVAEKRLVNLETRAHELKIRESISREESPYSPALVQILSESSRNSSALITNVLSNHKNLERYLDKPAAFIANLSQQYDEKMAQTASTSAEILSSSFIHQMIDDNLYPLMAAIGNGHFTSKDILSQQISPDLRDFLSDNRNFNAFSNMIKTKDDLEDYLRSTQDFLSTAQKTFQETSNKDFAVFCAYLSQPEIRSAITENKAILDEEHRVIHEDIMFSTAVHEALHSSAKPYYPQTIPTSKIARHYQAALVNNPNLKVLEKLSTHVKSFLNPQIKERTQPITQSGKLNSDYRERLNREFNATARNESITENLVSQVLGIQPTLETYTANSMTYYYLTSQISGYSINQPTTNLLFTLSNNDRYNIIKSEYLNSYITLQQLPIFDKENTAFNMYSLSHTSKDGKYITESNVPPEFNGIIDTDLYENKASSNVFDAFLARTQEEFDKAPSTEKPFQMAQRTQQLLLKTFKNDSLQFLQYQLAKVSESQKDILVEAYKDGSLFKTGTLTEINVQNLAATQQVQALFSSISQSVRDAFSHLTIAQDRSLTSYEERLEVYKELGYNNIADLMREPQSSQTIYMLMEKNIIAPTPNLVEYVQILEAVEMLENTHPLLNEESGHFITMQEAKTIITESLANETQSPTANNNSQLTPQPMVEDIDEDPLPNSEELLEQNSDEISAQSVVENENAFNMVSQTELDATKVIEQNMQTEQMIGMPATETISTETASVAVEPTSADDLSQ